MSYHKLKIHKHAVGSPYKIQEEFLEYIDAIATGNNVMAVQELSDLYGCIENEVAKFGMTVAELKVMSDLTREVFDSGTREAEGLLSYLKRGYEPLSAPMLVDKDIVEVTLPEGKKAKQHLDKFYVGSAEQSFYQLLKEGFQPEGSYMMLTPCQRDEIPSERNLEVFLKLELISMDRTAFNIDKDAYDLYTILGSKVKTVVTEGFSCLDLEVGGVEVGSYGSRIFNGMVNNYGTGLALPRFSQVRGNL